MNFITLTDGNRRPNEDGRDIIINTDKILYFNVEGGKTRIFFGPASNLLVNETVGEILSLHYDDPKVPELVDYARD